MNLSSKIFLRAGLAVLTAVVAVSASAAVNLGNVPLWFEAGRGSDDTATRFIAHGQDAEFDITPTGAEFTLRQADGHQAAVSMTFAGAGLGSQLTGDNVLGGKINYLLGNDPAKWETGIPTYGKVRLDQVYPGVNVVYYGNQQHLEYDFDLAASVNPETIAIRFDGAENISVDPTGDLVIQLHGGQIVQHVPVAYQTVSGERHDVRAGYKILDAHTVAFVVDDFNRALPLVIDPVLGYSAYFGGNSGETGWAIAINTNDNSIYLAGQTFSTQVSNNVPFTKNGIDTNFSGGAVLGDAFVAKLDSSGTNLLYATYLGGTGNNAAYALAVDSSGHAYVVGSTDTTNFPVTNSLSSQNFSGANMHGVYNSTYKLYPLDAFVAKLQTDGSSLIYSSYLGGSSWDIASAITVDENDNAYVTGLTYSSNFPVTLTTAWQTKLRCTNNFYTDHNAFVAEIAANGTNLNYSTYLGGTNQDAGVAIAYNNGMVFVAGVTTSTNFPWTNGLAACTNLNGFTNATPGSDAFVSMFKTVGTNLSLQYSTFLGSSNNDAATGIAADAAGNAYVVGWTLSTNFPNTTNGLQFNSVVRTNQIGFVIATNSFITKIAWNGSKATVAYSQTFGGQGVDVANGVALDAAGNIFIVGSASSTNFPVTPENNFGSLHSTNFSTLGLSDVFVTAITADLSALLYSTYIGGSANDFGYGIAIDTAGNAWVTGQTASTNYPVYGASWATNAVHTAIDGTNDVFLTKIVTGGAPVLSAARAGTNLLVFWPPVSDVTPKTLGLETVPNLLMPNVFNFTNRITNGLTITTNKGLTTNFISNTNWIVVASPVPVLTNGNYTYIFVNPTNAMQFYRFHHY